MADPMAPSVCATLDVLGVTLVDGGDTVAVRFRKADDSELALLLPLKVGAALVHQINEAAAKELAVRYGLTAPARDQGRPFSTLVRAHTLRRPL